MNLTDAGTRPGGAGAYAVFCARVAADEFGAEIFRTPSWVELLPAPAASLARYALSRLMLRGYRGTVYNPTYRAVPVHPSQIVTVFDLIPLRHPAQHRLQHRYFTRVLPGVLRAAAGVITLSETMRREVSQTFAVPEERVRVVPPGVGTEQFCPGPSPGDTPYLLAAGASLPHKNVHELLDRAGLWAGQYRLIVTGAHPSYGRRLQRQADALGLRARVTIMRKVDSQRLVDLYRGCAALVYPSLDEGFGLPPLEALACGRPVIVSDIPVHREVCGDAAIYVRLGDAGSWQAAMDGLDDSAGSAQRAAAGAARVRLYTWDATRTRLVEALRGFIGDRTAA